MYRKSPGSLSESWKPTLPDFEGRTVAAAHFVAPLRCQPLWCITRLASSTPNKHMSLLGRGHRPNAAGRGCQRSGSGGQRRGGRAGRQGGLASLRAGTDAAQFPRAPGTAWAGGAAASAAANAAAHAPAIVLSRLCWAKMKAQHASSVLCVCRSLFLTIETCAYCLLRVRDTTVPIPTSRKNAEVQIGLQQEMSSRESRGARLGLLAQWGLRGISVATRWHMVAAQCAHALPAHGRSMTALTLNPCNTFAL